MIRNTTKWVYNDFYNVMKFASKDKRTMLIQFCIFIIWLVPTLVVMGIKEGNQITLLYFIIVVLVSTGTFYFSVLFLRVFWPIVMTFSGQTMVISFEEEHISVEEIIRDFKRTRNLEYANIEGYIRETDSLCIKVREKHKLRYYPVHNNSYTEGSGEELVAFLENKNIHRIKK